MIEVKKREGESMNSLLYRFSKRMKQTGIMKEVKGRRFAQRKVNRGKRLAAALYRSQKDRELARARKYGFNKE